MFQLRFIFGDQMIDFAPLLHALSDSPLASWVDALRTLLAEAGDPRRNGNVVHWLPALTSLPATVAPTCRFNEPIVLFGTPDECHDADRERIEHALRRLCPWRKGPFQVFGTFIDTEWRSDFKWARLAPHISPLHGRRVLDIGCGSGYHCWRMLGAGAQWVLGVEPSLLYNIQFHALKYFSPHSPIFMLPLPLEKLPTPLPVFDTVFSMGVLYHRRSPIDHVLTLKALLRPGGELVLETLAVDGLDLLCPRDRYAKMNNVWFIPSCALLETWLYRCGFRDIRIVDVGTTTVAEQRRTDWMTAESLRDFLDPNDARKTVEGYPAPKRAIVVATAPT